MLDMVQAKLISIKTNLEVMREDGNEVEGASL